MQASMQVTEAAKGQPAFFRTNNGGYGTIWEAGRTDEPAEVPQYRELVSQSFHAENHLKKICPSKYLKRLLTCWKFNFVF